MLLPERITATIRAVREPFRIGATLLAASLLAGCGTGGGTGEADQRSQTPATQAAEEESRTVGSAPSGGPPTNRAWVVFSSDEGAADTVVAEIAATPEEREQGLMHRQELPDGTGMLFVFQDSQERSFWMANTFVPLDIAYMDESYAIVSILQMTPLDRSFYPSGAPAMYALEVPQGWFSAKGVEVGDRPEIVYGPKLGN